VLKNLFQNTDTANIIKWHHYFDIYEMYFSEYRGQKITILEIGVLDGGSLKLWKNYFGDKATVVGIDLFPPKHQIDNEGIFIEVGDQSDPNFISYLLKKFGSFDIVIDDGGHTNFLIKESFKLLFKHTNQLYVIEDTHAILWYKGFYSFLRDLKILINPKKNFIRSIFNLINLSFSLIVGKYSFYSHAIDIAKKATNANHKAPYKLFNKGDKIFYPIEKRFEDYAEIYSINFYDSLIIFKKSKPFELIVEYK